MKNLLQWRWEQGSWKGGYLPPGFEGRALALSHDLAVRSNVGPALRARGAPPRPGPGLRRAGYHEAPALPWHPPKLQATCLPSLHDVNIVCSG